MQREIKAPFGGSVESHVVSVGHQAEIGAVILTIECMKTMFPIEAPDAGTVVWLRSCGEVFETDDVVAILEVT